MLKVALTGSVAAGKSTVAERWRAAGVPVISADELARRAVEPGSPGLERVRARFGDDVIAGDGSLDRARLRQRVFEDDEARRDLEAIVHPVVWELRDVWTREREAEGAPLVVAEIPLLFETGREADFDVVVVVDAPEAVRLERMRGDRGLSDEEARAVMAAQLAPAVKRAGADVVIDNAGDRSALERRADEVLADLRARAEAAVGTMRVDLHMHTWGSWDCLSEPERVLERALQRGVERIAITDHDRIHQAVRMAERFPDRVIVGEEVKTAEGIDVIGLYLSEVIPRGTPAAETCLRIREQGGIAYLPHPFARGKGGEGRYAEELAPLVEVVEVFNGRLHPARLNEPAEALAQRHGTLRGAGSDAHTLREVARVWVELPRHPNTPEGLRGALRSGSVHGRTASNLVHLASTWAKVRKKLFGSPEPPGQRPPPAGANPEGGRGFSGG